MITNNEISMPIVKIGTSWGAVVITSWNDVAAILASGYTLLLILEWMWKKVIRPFCEKRKWLDRLYRRRDD